MLKIVYKKTDEIIPYENNPRFNDNAVEAVAKSIKEFGFKVPIVIAKDNVIVTGHTRHRSAKLLGLKEVPCVIAEDLTPEQIQAYRIADNKTGEIAEWNFDLLPLEIRELQEADFDLCQSEPLRGLQAGMPAYDDAVFVHDNRRAPAEFPDAGGHRLHGVVVVAGIALVGRDLRDLHVGDLHRNPSFIFCLAKPLSHFHLSTIFLEINLTFALVSFIFYQCIELW